ncbi:protein transcription factor [Solihabitans fulvus]|uniref:Protein transcription factor n=1 Tax=Solihabitans fulvus TaxID=1892852 RepID=A0A5B2XFD9_9PSEU|nr:type II toxin-antitoxin system VapB family antitoxin [Solihabitans fulvus]KAA2261630.1 protein transcription factor [Solihabitans fulvus]
MALNIKDAETERLAAEVAALTGESKTGAVRAALQERRDRLMVHEDAERRRLRLHRFLEEEIWPLIPPDELGKPLTKAEQEEILGIGPDGV